MSNNLRTTNVEEVLPNDEMLGRRNCCWRELVKKYENMIEDPEQAMDIDTVMKVLDQDMDSKESSVSDVEEASSQCDSAEENLEDISQQLKVAIPSRKRGWEANGLKEILDDQDFCVMSHEKVENWLQSQMYSISSSQLNVEYTTKEMVTTVTEEQCMKADNDSLYSVDTAQYIRSNKNTSNRVKVTTMIKQYTVTRTTRNSKAQSLGGVWDGWPATTTAKMKSLSPNHCDALPIQQQQQEMIKTGLTRAIEPIPHYTPKTRTNEQGSQARTRKKVFKKTVPRKKHDRAAVVCKEPLTPVQKAKQQEMYENALVQCAKYKRGRGRRKQITPNHRRNSSLSSSSMDNNSDDSDEVFRSSSQPRQASKTPRARARLMSRTNHGASTPMGIKPAAELPNLACKVCANSSCRCPLDEETQMPTEDRKAFVIYRPKTIQRELPDTARLVIRMDDLTLDGITKPWHLEKFREFNYSIHPNSTILFYPSDSESEQRPVSDPSLSCDTSLDDDDPILTFKWLNIIERPYRRQP
ncbi:uncharacterized protein LOC118457717 [Anopheles albimanus]|uniref:Uncharacterized protein n=1 Tax=Anopheles albimanus TaxID=7167 RepID=A0A182FAS7_ANOAL|nr:uncharacterized protein LOC118457717 [Anopheles albimanus]